MATQQQTLKDMMDNITSKHRAAKSLRGTSPSEASYLAGYCLECFLKCAIGLTGGYTEPGKPDRDWPFDHRPKKLKTAWLQILTQLTVPGQVYSEINNFISGPKFPRILADEWDVEKRYSPNWTFGDLERVINVELKDIQDIADQTRLNFSGRFV